MIGLLLVGGEGTRLRPLTYTRPKALIPLVNRPLIWYLLDLQRRHGVERVVLTVSHQHEQIEAALGSFLPAGMQAVVVREEEPRGTAGAIKNAEAHLGERFFAFNGDLVMDLDLGAMLRLHRERGAVVTIAVRRVTDPRSYGLIEREADGRVRAFLEKQQAPPAGVDEVNAGAYVMEPEVLAEIPAGKHWMNEYGLFPRLLKRGAPVYAYAQEGQWAWHDVGNAERYLEATRELLGGGTGFGLPESQVPGGWELVEPGVVDPSAMVGEGAVIGPNAVVGPGCEVGAGAVVREAALWEGACVGERAQVRRAIVGCGARIGAGVKLAEGAVVADSARVTTNRGT